MATDEWEIRATYRYMQTPVQDNYLNLALFLHENNRLVTGK